MAIALVSSVSKAGPSGGGTTSSIDTTGATLLVVTVARINTAVGTLSDSKSNTWTALTTSTQGSSSARIYYAENPTVGSGHTFTFSAASLFPAFGASAWSGTLTASVYEEENGNASTFSPLTTGSVTPDTDGSLLVACMCHGASSATIDSGFTEIYDHAFAGGTNFAGIAAYLIQGTAGALNPGFSTGSSAQAARIAVFKPAGGGATPAIDLFRTSPGQLARLRR